jgi:hypothetical protein
VLKPREGIKSLLRPIKDANCAIIGEDCLSLYFKDVYGTLLRDPREDTVRRHRPVDLLVGNHH